MIPIDDFIDDEDETPGANFEQLGFPKKRSSRLIKIILLVVALLGVISTIIFLLYFSTFVHKYQRILFGKKDSVATEINRLFSLDKLSGENSGDINLLFIGTRNKDMAGSYYSSAMMVVNIDTKNNKINLISIPRDLWVPIENKYGKANSIFRTAALNPEKYGDGGLPFTKAEFSKILGINFDYIYTCDFDGFADIVNKIGKVDIKMTPTEAASYPFLSENQFEVAEDSQTRGLYHLNGDQSFIFVRWPENAVPDFDRLRRMQLFVLSFSKQYVDTNLIRNFRTASEILDAADSNMRTDMQLWEIKRLVKIGQEVPRDNIIQHRLTTEVGTDGGLLRETQNEYSTTYSPLAGDNNFSQIQDWINKIVSN